MLPMLVIGVGGHGADLSNFLVVRAGSGLILERVDSG